MTGSTNITVNIIVTGADVPTAFDAVTTVEKVPVTVATPEIKPVLAFNDKPGGNGAALKLVGVWVAVI